MNERFLPVKRLAIVLFSVCVSTILSRSAVPQSTTGDSQDAIKHVDVPVHRGIVRAQAQQVDEQWDPPIVHLKGKVSVRIYPDPKTRSAAVIVQADQVDIDQTTGQISPRGNVHLGVADVK